ncbi:hypothetical protein HHK36_025625 [Tetracentron sinense]|uniref:Uncharacterized protein n=1 Tax=Tetracentron sinense TaxID=13715 RepID=A0A834YMX9_TETSI|nr:hypothetical protein HHK36_025625 [Tetracentron sinense]
MHLAVKNNQYDAIKYLVEKLNITKLINMPDNDGNTILHLVTAGEHTTMVTYLVHEKGIDVNAVNGNGFTALDVIESDVNNSRPLLLIQTLQEASCHVGFHIVNGWGFIMGIYNGYVVDHTTWKGDEMVSGDSIVDRRRLHHYHLWGSRGDVGKALDKEVGMEGG